MITSHLSLMGDAQIGLTGVPFARYTHSMLTSGTLIDTVSESLRIPRGTVAQYFRECREAGLITSSGARGVNAPAMTYLDLARLVIALVGLERPSGAAQGAELLCELRVPFPDKVDEGARRLDAALARVLEDLSNRDGDEVGRLEINTTELEASIYMTDEDYDRDRPAQVFYGEHHNSFISELKEKGLPSKKSAQEDVLMALATKNEEQGRRLQPTAIVSKRSVSFEYLVDVARQIGGTYGR